MAEPSETKDLLVVADDAASPVLASPATLIQGFRYLQQRIPGFTQLSDKETRALTRVASLDPEFIEAGLRAGCAWSETKRIIGHSGEELRQEAEEIRHWDEVESEVRALLKGISAANRKRRHRLGRAILSIYTMLGASVASFDAFRYLRPYYEEMKRAYQNRKRKRRKGEKPEE